MKYLSDGTCPGDTAFNVWPVPVTPVANMPKVSQKIHDDIQHQKTHEKFQHHQIHEKFPPPLATCWLRC